MDDDKMQGTEHQDQLPDMSREELDAEIGRLLGVYPVVRFLDGGISRKRITACCTATHAFACAVCAGISCTTGAPE